ncbi:uncharacterized protein LOC103315909 [Nasonia vitripennis]|uniref:Uncharacterized protein n=1 Tax=Nasonia vitripennis TaxID=7425 RepID=A0A7M7H408_NASVI|nr:uncharacterized protein LOC103315909 [Nasonia vitripennis]
MFLILRLFNSILFVVANVSVALYTLQRFFRAMRTHYQMVDEVEEYSNLVDQSRASLDYVGAKVMEALREMESDIGKEVYVTHNLTKLSTKIASVSRRFAELEEGIIELARLSHNMENATVETPSDINEEVRRILTSLKRHKSSAASEHNQRPQSHQRRTTRMSRSHVTSPVDPVQQLPAVAPNPVSKFTAVRPSRHRSRSPGLVPEVMLLDEQRRSPADKPIGFRPAWMCPV